MSGVEASQTTFDGLGLDLSDIWRRELKLLGIVEPRVDVSEMECSVGVGCRAIAQLKRLVNLRLTV